MKASSWDLVAPDEISRLLAESDLMSRPVVRRDACDPDRLENLVQRGLVRLCLDSTAQRDNALRLWVAGESDEAHEPVLFASKPAEYSGLKDWADGVFGDRGWGLVLNGAERWLYEIAETLAPHLGPVLERLPVPAARFELVLFLGNCTQTPFGLHRDPPNLRSIHFQLNGSAKTFYVDVDGVMPDGRFPSLADISENCATFEIEPGDAFLIPAHLPHLGANTGFSGAVALVLRRDYHNVVIRRALVQAAGDLSDNVPPPRDVCDIWQEEDLDFANIESVSPSWTLLDWIRSATADYVRRQTSNSGFTNPPILGECAVETPTEIRLARSFPLFIVKRRNVIEVIARGERFHLDHSPGLWDWLDKFTLDGETNLEDDAERFSLDIAYLRLIARELGARGAAQIL